jgi:hypothetical protein
MDMKSTPFSDSTDEASAEAKHRLACCWRRGLALARKEDERTAAVINMAQDSKQEMKDNVAASGSSKSDGWPEEGRCNCRAFEISNWSSQIFSGPSSHPT